MAALPGFLGPTGVTSLDSVARPSDTWRERNTSRDGRKAAESLNPRQRLGLDIHYADPSGPHRDGVVQAPDGLSTIAGMNIHPMRHVDQRTSTRRLGCGQRHSLRSPQS
jgi:hypothetical protein